MEFELEIYAKFLICISQVAHQFAKFKFTPPNFFEDIEFIQVHDIINDDLFKKIDKVRKQLRNLLEGFNFEQADEEALKIKTKKVSAIFKKFNTNIKISELYQKISDKFQRAKELSQKFNF